MDATTLYLIATLATGEHRLVRQLELSTNRQCQEAAEWTPNGHLAQAHKKAGAVSVWAYCAPQPNPIVIAR